MKKNIVADIDKCIEKLYIAHVKFRTARNIFNRIKQTKIDSVLFVSAMYGVPFSSRQMAYMFIDSALRDLKGIIKKLHKIDKYLEKNDPPRHVLFHKRIAEIITVLNKLRDSKDMNIEQYIDETEKALDSLRELNSVLAGIYNFK